MNHDVQCTSEEYIYVWSRNMGMARKKKIGSTANEIH